MTSYTDEQVLNAAVWVEADGSKHCGNVIRSLLADRTRLQAEVENAYREGFEDGCRDAMDDERGRGGDGVDECWKHSNTCKAIDSVRAKKVNV